MARAAAPVLHRAPMTRGSLLFVVAATLLACGGGGGGCGAGGFTQLPRGSATAQKLDSAAAVRLSQRGFAFLNQSVVADGGLLEQMAPGGELRVPISCSIQPVMVLGIGLENMAIADRGTEGCTSTSCGRMDGICDARDVPQEVTIRPTALSFAPKGPDLIEANIQASISTGKLWIASVNRNSLLCLLAGGGAALCSVDFDTARSGPSQAQLAINIKLTVDPRWDRLLALEVTEIGGSKVCGGAGAEMPPRCLETGDIVLANEGACTFCTTANFSIIKGILLDQMSGSLKKALDKTVGSLLCTPCASSAECPRQGTATSICKLDDDDGGIVLDGGFDAGADGGEPPGRCMDPVTNKCVPRLLGIEGQLALGQALGSLGVSPSAGIELGVAVGGGASASAQGLTVGVRGGAKELQVATCVQPVMAPTPTMLPLPDFELGRPDGGYDLGFSLSQQLLGEALFRAQQSGALCLEVGQELVTQLDSEALSLLLPSVRKLTASDGGVPLRLVIRPVNPPTVSVGANTVNAMGKPEQPLLRLAWDDLEIDLYALLFDRYARLFTLSADLALPLGVAVEGCGQLRPTIGSLSSAVSDVRVKNNEMIPESIDVLASIVPTILSMAEPSLAQGLGPISLPLADGGTSLRIDAVKGIVPITSTQQFQHVGIYASFVDGGCMATSGRLPASLANAEPGAVELDVPGSTEVAVRINGGLWSEWKQSEPGGRVRFEHPRLWLKGEHLVEVQQRGGVPTGLWVKIEGKR